MIQSPYDKEINMGYSLLDSDGVSHLPVYGIKKKFEITQSSLIVNTIALDIKRISTDALNSVHSILQYGGTYQYDGTHSVALPSSPTQKYYVELSLEKEGKNIIDINTYSTSDRQNAILDLWILYTKEV